MSFSGNRLRVGRLFRGLTQRELAEQVAVSHGAVAFYEKGLKEPKPDVLEALAVVIGVEPRFFLQADVDEFREEESNFRRRISATERQKKQVLAQGTLFATLVQHLQQKVATPKLDLPAFTPESLDDIDRVADATREYWGLPLDAPIGSVARVIERAGVLLLTTDLQTARRVDAFSRFGITSIVVLNTEKESPSRTRFDEAHELGHGVLHRNGRRLPLNQRELEADRFAGAFLLPSAAFTREMMGLKPRDWAYLFELKRHWGVSIKAILYRAYEIGLIDAADYRTRMRYYAYRGWNAGEPEEPAADRPALFYRLLEQYQLDTAKSISSISSDMGWSAKLFADVTGVVVEDTGAKDVLSLADYRDKSA